MSVQKAFKVSPRCLASLLALLFLNQVSATDVVCFFESKTSMPQAATPSTFKTLGDRPVSLWTGTAVKQLKFDDTIILEFPKSLVQDFPGKKWLYHSITGQKILVPFNDVWVNQNIHVWYQKEAKNVPQYWGSGFVCGRGSTLFPVPGEWGKFLVTSASSENIARLVVAKLSDKLDQNVTQALSGKVVLGKGQRIPADKLKISANRVVQAEILSSSDHVMYYPTRVKQSQGEVIFEYDLHNRLPRSVSCTMVQPSTVARKILEDAYRKYQSKSVKPHNCIEMILSPDERSVARFRVPNELIPFANELKQTPMIVTAIVMDME